MAGKQRVPKEVVARLGEYWLRAELMHEFLHMVREEFDGDIDKIYADGHGLEWETYLSFWLSGLFVVVEGFNKSGLKDERVQKLFKGHLVELKQLRHGTYHFALERPPLPMLNWAEELHESIGAVIGEHVRRKARVERLLEIRTKSRKL